MQPNQTPKKHSLFCKPTADENRIGLYKSSHDFHGKSISFRSMNLKGDIDLIYDWVNRDYSKKFWQLNGSKQLVQDTYNAILDNPATHSFIGLLNNTPVCQVDIYLVLADELASFVESSQDDCGMHFLMMPPEERPKGLALAMFKAFLSYYFSFQQATTMYGEPDCHNVKANQLVQASGFKFLSTIKLSYKTAYLYRLLKSEFLSN